MKPQMGTVRKWENQGDAALGAVGLWKHGVAQTLTLFLQPVEEAARPNEFRSQHAQGHEDNQPTGPGQNNEYDAGRQERETEQHPEKLLCLLERLQKHVASLSVVPGAPFFRGRDGGLFCRYLLECPRENKAQKPGSTRIANDASPCSAHLRC